MESESRKEMESESRKEMEMESGKLVDHQAELFMLHEEIMSLARERKDLLASLTPNLFVWEGESAAARKPAFNSQEKVGKLRPVWKITGKASTSSLTEPVSGSRNWKPEVWKPEVLESYLDSIVQDMENLGREEESVSTLRIAGNASSVQMMDSSLTEPVAVSGSRPSWQPEELENYLDSILEDMEDLGHRILSMADNNTPRELDAPISSYKKAELFAATSRLLDISKCFYSSNVQIEDLACPETGGVSGEAHGEEASSAENKPLSNEFLDLLNNYFEHPDTYTKHLAVIITEKEKKEEEEEEKEKEKEKEREKTKKKKVKEDYDGVFDEETESKEYLKKRMVLEQGFFSNYRVGWEHLWGSKIGRCGGFQDTTTLSPMHFTHCTPGIMPHGAFIGSTLQIYSFEIQLKADLQWPLRVYGVVAARDTVDRNRNLLFCRSRANHQVLTRDDPFLRLTGPSRAILASDHIDFEVQLKIIDGYESKDRALISLFAPYAGRTFLFQSPLCTGRLILQEIHGTVQATIVGVQVARGDWPFKYGARVVCSLLGAMGGADILLLDSHSEEITVGADGYLPLSRNVVSVEVEGGVKIVIQAYLKSGIISDEGHVFFHGRKHGDISQDECSVGDSQVKITVAWSPLVQDKMDLLTEGYAAQA